MLLDILVNESFIPKAMDCTDVLQMGHKRSGIYEIWPVSRVTDGKPLRVYCDMDTNGGGWTVNIFEFYPNLL